MGMTDAYYQNRQYAPFARKVWQQTRLREQEPAASLLTVDEAKNFLGIPLSDTCDDQLISGLIDAATEQAERFTGRAFINRTVNAFYDFMPWLESVGGMGTSINRADVTVHGGRVIALRRLPLDSVTRIAWHQEDGSSIDPWDTANYQVDAESKNVLGRVIFKQGVDQPTNLQEGNGLEVEYVAGYGPTADDVPYGIKHAVLMLVAFMFQNRGDCVSGGSGEMSPLAASGAKSALRTYRYKEMV